MARRAVERNDGLAAAEAVAGAMAIRPGVNVDGVALPIARHFQENGEFARALPFYERAVRESGRNPQVVFDLARAYDEVGDCATAIDLFQQVWSRLNTANRQDADWRTGTCSMELAAESRGEGQMEEALRHYETTITLQQPRGMVPDAWFAMGEILAELGRCEEARAAFQAVEDADPSPSLREAARNRADGIRFRGRDASGPC
jgi:tetratricopeptide (TPR) repeat protein